MCPSDNRERLHRLIRRWQFLIGHTLGFKIEPKVLIVLSTMLVLSMQIILYLLFTSTVIYCKLPNLRWLHLSKETPSYEKLPTVYVITPTYDRFVQKAELTRLSHTLMLVPNLHWIIVEDSVWRTDVVSRFVRRLKNEFDFQSITHLQEPTPEKFKIKKGEPDWKRPKGIWQRNKALDWVEDNLVDLDHDGVLYFADDDNTYDLSLFNEIRYTRKVSVLPVGLVGGMLVERPIVSGNRVEAFTSMWKKDRPFPFDMAGFAISLHLFINHRKVRFSADQPIGYVESHFLSQLVNTWDELEPKANKCSKVLVWHTKTQKPALHEERKLVKPSHSEIEW